MKLFVIFGIITIMATVAMTRHAIWGQRSRGDRLLLGRNITLFPKIGKNRTRYVTYGPRVNKYVITAIYAQDNFKNSSGAVGDIEHGGVGKSFAVIRLSTNKSQGMNSTVLVFGKLANNRKLKSGLEKSNRRIKRKL